MQTTLQPHEDKITLEFGDVPEAEKFFEEALRQSGFFLQLDRQLKQFQRLVVTAVAPGFRFRCEAEVVQVFPNKDGPTAAAYGSAFQLYDWTPAKERELQRQLRAGEQQDEHNVSPVFRIQKMDVNERFRLAIKASRPERQILLRDSSPQVLLGLLAHPRIEDKEVKAIIDSATSTGAIMKRVASNRKWMSNHEIQLSVVRSPKTPPPLAIKLMPTLRTPDLRILAKGGPRENVRKAALKTYLARIGRG